LCASPYQNFVKAKTENFSCNAFMNSLRHKLSTIAEQKHEIQISEVKIYHLTTGGAKRSGGHRLIIYSSGIASPTQG
jgi:hypothetical protein